MEEIKAPHYPTCQCVHLVEEDDGRCRKPSAFERVPEHGLPFAHEHGEQLRAGERDHGGPRSRRGRAGQGGLAAACGKVGARVNGKSYVKLSMADPHHWTDNGTKGTICAVMQF